MAKAIPDHIKAEAVSRVRNGEALRAVAKDYGVTFPTIRRWRIAVEETERYGEKEPEPDRWEGIAEQVDEIGEMIAREQEAVRYALIKQLAQVLPASESVKDLATAYGIITDKSLLLAGKPTSINQETALSGEESVEELERIAKELESKKDEDKIEA